MEHEIYDAATHGKLYLIKSFLETRPKSERVTLLSTKTGGATPLIAACRNGHYDVAEYLIKNCGADVDLVGSVVFDGETIEEAPPLWCAAAAGNLKIVKLLVSNNAKINSTTKTLSSPLRASCYDGHLEVVQYLVQNGADIELANRHGHTCLMIACYKCHYSIAKYLVEKGANLNRKSIKANTALHDAAESGSLNIIQLLLSKGAVFDKDSYGMSPLFAAAVAGHAHIVDYIIDLPKLVSSREKIDALELLGATLVDNKKDMLGAHRYWKKALDWRHRKGKLLYPKPRRVIPVYEGHCEVDKYEELDELILDPDQMRMQSLMIRERVLGAAHPDTSYYIRYRGAIYADAGQFDRCISLWMYALNMQQNILPPMSPITQSSFLSFAELFWFMVSEKRIPLYNLPTLQFSHAYEVYTRGVREIETSHAQLSRIPGGVCDLTSFNRLLIIILQIMTVLLSVSKTEKEDFKFRKMSYELVRLNVRGMKGWTLLHLAASSACSVGRFALKNFPIHKTVEFLIQVGSELETVDESGNSPLHIAASFPSPFKFLLLSTLLTHGSHPDTKNYNNLSIQQILSITSSSHKNINETNETNNENTNETSGQILVQLNMMTYLSLKCLAARVVRKYDLVKQEDNLPTTLRNFIQMH